MEIRFIEPLSRGWKRMVKALFKPFDIKKWFVVGFTVFLADLMDSDGGGGGSWNLDKKHNNFDDFFNFPRIAWEWLEHHPLWFTLIVVGLILLIILVVVLTWLSSRGKFMFLNNVVHDKAEVVKPWYDYKMQGNSLFLWRLVFGFICFLIFLSFLVGAFFIGLNIHQDYYPFAAKVFLILGLVLSGLLMLVFIGYISLFLNDFIVPIMYKFNLKAVPAWSRFLHLLGKNFFYFILYGLIIFILYIGVVIGVILFGLFTCCCGILLIIIPYIGSVILLPVSYTFRSFSVEFLEQFGPDYKIFPAEAIETTEDQSSEQNSENN